MPDSTELFRDTLASQLAALLPPDKLHDVLSAFDVASSGYNISKKNMEIIVSSGVPELVKWFIASKAVANCSPKTLAQYKYKLFNFFNEIHKPITDITTNDVRLYLYNYKTTHNVGDRTIEHTRVILNTFFQWCMDNDYMPRNPVAKIEHVKFHAKERVPLTSYELELIRWVCTDIREKALIDFLYSTGCRVGECSDANISDIDWQKRMFIIRHGKGDKQRVVFFNAESELSLRKYLETRTDNNEALFVGCRAPYRRLSIRAIEVIVKKIGERTMLETFPHRLRHTFGTMGIKGGVPLERLQALMGHSSPSTTLIYAKLDAAELQKEHARVYA